MTGERLSVLEVAARLGVSRSTVDRWIKAGELPALNIGTGTLPRYRIDPDDLEEFIARRRT